MPPQLSSQANPAVAVLDQQSDLPSAEQVLGDGPENYQAILGRYAPFDWSEQPFVPCDERQKAIFNSLAVNVARADIASRYLEVSQAWEARLFNRGYQHLIPRVGGGFDLPGANSIWGPIAVADASANYPINIYGRDKDIISGALGRDIPKVQFFPRNPSRPEDIEAAEIANKFAYLYEKNADLRHVLAMMSLYFYTEDRVVLYTRRVLDGPRYGYNPDGSPRGNVQTDVMGKLDSKVAMQAQENKEMNFLQLYWDIDITYARAMAPWIRKRIESYTHGVGELGFDFLARISTRQGLYGRIITGDSLARTVTKQYTWFRPMTWYDDIIRDEDRDWYFENFPDGALVCFMGQEFAFARNESMDDHVHVVHAYEGLGQNRRSLGSNNIPVQKRLNNFMDLLDDFSRRCIPRLHYDAERFSMESIEQQNNTPGYPSPVERKPGESVEQLFALEPTPQPQPFLFQMAQWYFSDIPASLSGAMPAIYGGDETGPTPVGTQVLQRDAALGRLVEPWNHAKQAMTLAFEDAVKAAAASGENISGVGPGGKIVTVDTSKMRGQVYAYAEYDSEIPETWRQREARYTEIIAAAPENPIMMKMVESPRNLRAVADNIQLSELEVPGEPSVRKQLSEIELLKRAAPVPNPQYVAGEQALMGAEQQGADPQQLQQAATALSQLPQQVSSVPVAQDASENHQIEAETCFEWMNSTEGVKFKNGLGPERAGFENVHLHWSEHLEMAQKLSQPQSQKPPSVSINFKDMPPAAQVQALKDAGIGVSKNDVEAGQLQKTHRKIAEKIVPKTMPETIRTVKRPQ